MEQKYTIRDAAPQHSFYSQIPNMIDDAGLSPSAFRLYIHLKRVTGDNSGVCYQSSEYMAESCDCSKPTILTAKKELLDAGLIQVEEVRPTNGGHAYHLITIVDIWKINEFLYDKKNYTILPEKIGKKFLPMGKNISQTSVKIFNRLVKLFYLKNTPIKNTPNKEDIPQEEQPADTPPKNPKYIIAKALSEVTGMDLDKNKGRLFKNANDFTIEEVEQIKKDYGPGGKWYQCDWRGIKGEKPKPEMIKETWGALTPPIPKNGNGHAKPFQGNPGPPQETNPAWIPGTHLTVIEYVEARQRMKLEIPPGMMAEYNRQCEARLKAKEMSQ